MDQLEVVKHERVPFATKFCTFCCSATWFFFTHPVMTTKRVSPFQTPIVMIYGRQPHLQTSWQLTCIIPPSNNQPPSTLALLVVVAEIISARENLLLPSQEWLSAVGWSHFIPHKLRYNRAAVGCTLAVKFVVYIPDTIQPRCGSQESGKATLNMCRWRWVLLGIGVRVTTWLEIFQIKKIIQRSKIYLIH